MRAEIINIGDELLIGQVVNTNSAWLASEMDSAGFPVMRISVIGDSFEEIMNALTEAESRSEIILMTGGLGPTRDDITKEVLCKYFRSRLIIDEPSLENVKRIFTERGLPVTELNRKQAEIPDVSLPLHNRFGTAPGMWLEKKCADGRTVVVISLPGVPYEMKTLFSEQVLPRLNQCFPGLPKQHRTILTQGIGESFLSDIISDWETSLPESLHLAYLPQPGMVRLRLTGTGERPDLVSALIEREVNKLYELIPQYIFGEQEETLEAIIGKLLITRKSTLSTAESCTGGYIAHLITRIPGSSAYFKGSVVAYSNEVKMNELNVSEESLKRSGAVSETVVREMAAGIQQKFNTDYAIATSGIAGPDGGTKDKPVGTTWIAIATPKEILSSHYLMGDERERNIRKTALQALNLLRKAILTRE